MPTVSLVLPKPHSGQLRVISEARRFNSLACGRRWGKTTLGIDRVVLPALEGYPAGWFSPTYKMLLEAWRETTQVLRPVARRINTQERRIELVTGGLVEMWSLTDPNAARGRKYKRVVIDEAAMVRYLQEAWQEVIRPALADYQGDAWFLSTPKGFNFFKVLFDLGQEDGDHKSWQQPTSANPFISADEIAEMQRMLPERVFSQEILAKFLDDAGGVFRRVAQAATAVEKEKAESGRSYVFGVDWGKYADFTVVVALDDTGAMATMERFNQIDYEIQKRRLIALAERFHPITVIAERNSMGEPVIESLQRMGLPVEPFTTSNASKAQAIDALTLAFERGIIQILPDPVLIEELQAYDMERLPSGLLRYGAPAGMHDDCVMALALAWQGLCGPRVEVVYDESLRARVNLGY